MNNQQRRVFSSPVRAFAMTFFVVFYHIAAASYSPAKAADNDAQFNPDCLFNWAQTFYSNLFSPPVSGLQFFAPYTYRYYPNTDSYVGVSSVDDHVYYLGPQDDVPRDVGELSAWLVEAGCGAHPYPVIFIHGLASSAETWDAYRDYLIKNAGWTFGGIAVYHPDTKTTDISCPADPVQLAACTGTAGDFYTLNFSDNQNLPFAVQGGELASIITTVLAENPDATKVLLIAHSMGGLAAREYLQGLARMADSETTISYWDDVAKLITVGTPHQGSFWAEACHNSFDSFDFSVAVGICDLFPLPIDGDSIAVMDLMPHSAALNTLNDMILHPLPGNVTYISIIGTGQATLLSLDPPDFEAGDGIVSATSQDLQGVSGSLVLLQQSVSLDIVARECGNQIDVPFVGNVGETHTCETSDMDVGREILRNLEE